MNLKVERERQRTELKFGRNMQTTSRFEEALVYDGLWTKEHDNSTLAMIMNIIVPIVISSAITAVFVTWLLFPDGDYKFDL